MTGKDNEKLKAIVLLDVTPLSLGILTDPTKDMSVLVPRNSAIPAKKEGNITMVKDAETYKAKDDEHRKKSNARKALVDYACKVRNTINDEKIGAKFDPKCKKKTKDAIEHIFQWLDDHELVDSGLYEEKIKWIQSVCNPISI